MGYLSGIANQGFKQTTDGQTAYYPFGIFSRKGYIVEEPNADKIRKLQKIYFFVYMPIIVIGINLLMPRYKSYYFGSMMSMLILLPIVYAIFFGLYFWKIRPLFINRPRYGEKLKYWELLKYQALKFGSGTITGLIILNVLMLSMGIIVAISTGFKLWADFSLLFFLFTLIVFIYMYKYSDSNDGQKVEKSQVNDNS
jgi:hypothetical protein